MKIIRLQQYHNDNNLMNNTKIEIKDENMLFLNNVLNKLNLETYIYNKTLLHTINKTDFNIYSFTCISKEQYNIKNIEGHIIENCKDKIDNVRIENNHLIFSFPNKNKDSKYKGIEVYINIFSLNIKYDVYFTLTNLKLNINTGTLSLINDLNEFKPEYISKLCKNVSSNNEFYDICVDDLFKGNIQFLLSHKLDCFVKKKFSNKYEFKIRIEYYLNDVLNFLPVEKRNKLMTVVENDFKKSNKMSLKYLIIQPGDVNIDDTCLICCDNLDSEECFKLPCCGKFMHKNCVLECEKHSHKCPNCRRNWYI